MGVLHAQQQNAQLCNSLDPIRMASDWGQNRSLHFVSSELLNPVPLVGNMDFVFLRANRPKLSIPVSVGEYSYMQVKTAQRTRSYLC